jgi:hypothetical protein
MVCRSVRFGISLLLHPHGSADRHGAGHVARRPSFLEHDLLGEGDDVRKVLALHDGRQGVLVGLLFDDLSSLSLSFAGVRMRGRGGG